MPLTQKHPKQRHRKRSLQLTDNGLQHLLGLGRRAGTLVLGGEQVRSSLKRDEIALVVVARDRSQRTEDKVTRLAKALSVPVVMDGSAIEMGRAVGRGAVQVIGVRDRQLAAGIQAGNERRRSVGGSQ